jgi:hypothetical protein
VDVNLTSSLPQLTAAIAGVGALGTAAFGLVDSFKMLPGGGISRAGFKFIRRTILKLAPKAASPDGSGSHKPDDDGGGRYRKNADTGKAKPPRKKPPSIPRASKEHWTSYPMQTWQ